MVFGAWKLEAGKLEHALSFNQKVASLPDFRVATLVESYRPPAAPAADVELGQLLGKSTKAGPWGCNNFLHWVRFRKRISPACQTALALLQSAF